MRTNLVFLQCHLDDRSVTVPKLRSSNVSELQAHPNFSFAQPGLSRSNGNHHLREGTNLGVFVPVWLVLRRGEVFDLCRFDPLKWGCANSGGFGAR